MPDILRNYSTILTRDIRRIFRKYLTILMFKPKLYFADIYTLDAHMYIVYEAQL